MFQEYSINKQFYLIKVLIYYVVSKLLTVNKHAVINI